MNQKYTDEELLDKLKSLLEDKGTLNYSIVENEPNFPSRHAFQEHFGSLYNAFTLIGFEGKKGRFNIQDAQAELDQRNGHF